MSETTNTMVVWDALVENEAPLSDALKEAMFALEELQSKLDKTEALLQELVDGYRQGVLMSTSYPRGSYAIVKDYEQYLKG